MRAKAASMAPFQDECGVSDGRDDLPIFIHSELDDTPLSSEAFRLYAHIARRAGQKGGLCWSSYQSMGDTCFIVDYPNSKITRRNHAISGIKELSEKRLISIEKRKNGKSENLTNVYTLNPKRFWKKEDGSPIEPGSSPTGLDSSPPEPGSSHVELPGSSPPEPGSSPPEPKGTPMKLLHSSEVSPFKGEEQNFEKKKSNSEEVEQVFEHQPSPSSHSNQSDAPSSTTQGVDRSAAEKFEQNFNDRAENKLPPWRTGRGPNDWDEDILTEYVRRADEKYAPKKHDRADAVGYFSNCETAERRGDGAGVSKAVALCQELRRRLLDRSQRQTFAAAASADLSHAPSESPLTPEEAAQKLADLKALIATVNR